MVRIFFVWLPLIALLGVGAHAQTTPSVEELRDRYLLQRAKMGGVHVRWTFRFENTTEYYQLKRAIISRSKNYLENSNITGEARKFEERALESQKTALESPRNKLVYNDVWFQGKNCQVRVLPDSATGANLDTPVPLDAETLSTTFADTKIASFLEGRSPAMTLWAGAEDGPIGAQVYRNADAFRDVGSIPWLPPFASANSEWGEASFHPYDRFMLGLGNTPGQEERVVETPLTLSIVTTVSEPVPAHDGVSRVTELTAKLDPEHGYIPESISRKKYYLKDGRRLIPADRLNVNRIVRTETWVEPESGIFYPAKGASIQYAGDFRRDDSPVTLERQLRGDIDPMPGVIPTTITHWTIATISTGLEIPDEFFALDDLPSRTMVLDTVRREGEMVGVDEKDLEENIRTAIGRWEGTGPGAMFSSRLFWVLGTGLLIGLCVGYVSWRYYKARR